VSVELYRELSWFPKPPEDFSFLCKELSADSGDLGERIRFLAIHALDERQLARLGRAIIQAQQNGRSLAPLVPFRLGLIGNGTLDLIVPVLIATAARLLGWGIKHRKRDRILPALAFWASLLAILHSQLDFSLQIPGFAVILALTGMGAASFSGTGPLALAAGLLLPRSLSRIPAFVAAAFGLLMVLLILYNLQYLGS
jgi:hypothetical protein